MKSDKEKKEFDQKAFDEAMKLRATLGIVMVGTHSGIVKVKKELKGPNPCSILSPSSAKNG